MEDATVFASDDYGCVSLGTRILLPLVGDAIRCDLDIYTTGLSLVRDHIHHQLHTAALHYPGKRIHSVVAFCGAGTKSIAARERVIQWTSEVSMGLLEGWGPFQEADQVLFERTFSIEGPLPVPQHKL
jgi:hypothetical protein